MSVNANLKNVIEEAFSEAASAVVNANSLMLMLLQLNLAPACLLLVDLLVVGLFLVDLLHLHRLISHHHQR